MAAYFHREIDLVSGDTFPHRKDLARAGAAWLPFAGQWLAPPLADDIADKLRAAGLRVVRKALPLRRKPFSANGELKMAVASGPTAKHAGILREEARGTEVEGTSAWLLPAPGKRLRKKLAGLGIDLEPLTPRQAERPKGTLALGILRDLMMVSAILCLVVFLGTEGDISGAASGFLLIGLLAALPAWTGVHLLLRAHVKRHGCFRVAPAAYDQGHPLDAYESYDGHFYATSRASRELSPAWAGSAAWRAAKRSDEASQRLRDL